MNLAGEVGQVEKEFGVIVMVSCVCRQKNTPSMFSGGFSDDKIIHELKLLLLRRENCTPRLRCIQTNSSYKSILEPT